MDEPFYLGAYWGPRREPAEACARRLADCIARLGACSEQLRSWYEKADRKADAKRRLIEPDPEAVGELMLAGVNRRDADLSVIEELGFSAGLWNGDFETSVGLSVDCGKWASAQGLMNAFSLDLPPPPPRPGAQLYELDTALAIMRAVVEAWEPDWATLTSHRLADALDAGPRRPIVGWITFLAERRNVPDHLSVAARDLVPGRGTLLVAAERADDLEVSKLREIADALDQAGTLTPTP